jgi:hypothetical protein
MVTAETAPTAMMAPTAASICHGRAPSYYKNRHAPAPRPVAGKCGCRGESR